MLSDILENQYFPKNRGISSDSTRTHYRCAVKTLTMFLGRQPVITDLNDETIEDWITWSLRSGWWSPYTVKQRRGYLVALWNWLAKKRMVESFPAVAPVRPPEIVPDAWTEAEVGLLMRHCERQLGEFCGVPERFWWPSIHAFWYYHGERISATLSARWDQISDDVLVIPAESRKGRRKPAIYVLHPDVLVWLAKIREPPRELIWPYPRCRSMFWKRYKQLIISAGLPYRLRTGPHKMRRTHATLIEKYGGDASLSLMHSSSAVTRKHYIDPRIAHAEPENRKLPRIA